jgi:hypothetical protein
MPNKSGNAYALTCLCPIWAGIDNHRSHAAMTRDRLQDWDLQPNEASPMAHVPNTYMCRFFILNDLIYQSKPAQEDHLKSKYLVFTTNFHGELEQYLKGMWGAAEDAVKEIWQYCVGFERVNDADSFVRYIKKCQIKTTFFFNGSTDEALDVQLKSLYLKQEFSKFVYQNQGKRGEDLRQAFGEFVAANRPDDLSGPTWKPGASDLNTVVQ